MLMMNALVYHPPGGPDKMKYEKFEVPGQLDSGEMLVKVAAAGVMYQGLRPPKIPTVFATQEGSYPPVVLCSDFAGTVVQIGPGFDNSDIKVGSEIMAFTTTRHDSGPKEGMKKYNGAAAEYAVATLDTAVLKPNNISLSDAASVPLPALTAWQALYDHGSCQTDQRVLITGIAGATGLWAAQMAHHSGAEVIGTASSQRSFELMSMLGVKEVINYKNHRLEDAVKDKFDLIVDCVGNAVGGDVLHQCAKVVKPEGKIVSVVDFMAAQQVPDGVKAEFFIVETKVDQLKKIGELIEAGVLRAFVDSTYALEKGVEAYQKGAQVHAHGRILIDLSK